MADIKTYTARLIHPRVNVISGTVQVFLTLLVGAMVLASASAVDSFAFLDGFENVWWLFFIGYAALPSFVAYLFSQKATITLRDREIYIQASREERLIRIDAGLSLETPLKKQQKNRGLMCVLTTSEQEKVTLQFESGVERDRFAADVKRKIVPDTAAAATVPASPRLGQPLATTLAGGTMPPGDMDPIKAGHRSDIGRIIVMVVLFVLLYVAYKVFFL